MPILAAEMKIVQTGLRDIALVSKILPTGAGAIGDARWLTAMMEHTHKEKPVLPDASTGHFFACHLYRRNSLRRYEE